MTEQHPREHPSNRREERWTRNEIFYFRKIKIMMIIIIVVRPNFSFKDFVKLRHYGQGGRKNNERWNQKKKMNKIQKHRIV